MSAIRRRWRFTGTVQGVGFRYYARAAAPVSYTHLTLPTT